MLDLKIDFTFSEESIPMQTTPTLCTSCLGGDFSTLSKKCANILPLGRQQLVTAGTLCLIYL